MHRISSFVVLSEPNAFDIHDEDMLNTIKEFEVVELIDELVEPCQENLLELDQILEKAKLKLMKARHQVEMKVCKMEDQSEMIQRQYEQRSNLPKQLVGEIEFQIQDLEHRFRRVSATAVGIGDRLDKIETERKRLEEAKRLLDVFNELNQPDGEKMYQKILESNDLVQAATILSQVTAISQHINTPDAHLGAKNANKYCQLIEMQLLEDFSAAHDADPPDIERMKACGTALLEFQGREKVVERFVWNTVKSRLIRRQRNQISAQDRQEDFDFVLVKIDRLCQEQFPIITQVFPPSLASTMQHALIERLFHDTAFGVQCYLEKLLRLPQRSSISTDYLDLMCYSYENLGQVAQKIQQQTLPCVEAAFLQKHINALFVMHKQHFVRYQIETAQKRCKDITKMIQYPTAPVARQDTIISPFSNSRKAHREVLWQDKLTALVEIAVQKDMGFLDISAAAVRRCTIMFGETEAGAELIAKVFQLVCSSLLEGHCAKLIQLCPEIMKSIEASVTLSCDFFKILRALTHVVEELEQQFLNLLSPALSKFPTQLTICLECKRRGTELIENTLALCIEQVADKILEYAATILSIHQDKHDFDIKGDGFFMNVTKACNLTLIYLHQVFQDVTQCLNGTNIKNFGNLIALAFSELLIAHILKFRINSNGAFALMRDIEGYNEAFSIFEIPDCFKTLRQVSNAFIVAPENLQALVRDGEFDSLETTLMDQLIRQRSDYKQCILNGGYYT